MARASETQKAQFAPVRLEDWRAGVGAELKGKRAQESLVARTSEGLVIQPLYADQLQGVQSLPARREASWRRRETLDVRELRSALERLARAAEFGIDSFRVEGCASADEGQLIGAALSLGVELHFPAATDHKRALGRLGQGLMGSQHVPCSDLTGELLDIWKAGTGQSLLHHASSAMEQGRGAGEQLQVALCLWRGAEWLRAATSNGLTIEQATDCFEFDLSLGCDLFLELAKLRALRLAWQKLLLAFGAESCRPARIHASSSLRAWTRNDPWTNALRGTTIAFSAATGGADSILVAPWDAMLGCSEPEALRLAANTHAILAQESHMGAVEDPAAGSGYIESLTEDLAAGAWKLLRKLETLNGQQAQAWIQQAVTRSAQAEAADIATRRRAIIGVSEYANIEEQVPGREACTLQTDVVPLAEAFERLRAMSDAQLALTGSRPRAFLANIGAPADFRARADFARDLLAAGGIEVLDNDGFDSAGAALAAHKTSGTKLVVIASSPALCSKLVPDLAEGLRARGACVVVTGRPGAEQQAWSALGVAHYIHMGCDAVEVLRCLHAAENEQA